MVGRSRYSLLVRKMFLGHHPLTSDEIESLWTTSLLVVDTNVLLRLYRLSKEAREKFLSLLRGQADRLWIPYQVAQEFHANRVAQIRAQQSMGAKLSDTLGNFDKEFSSLLGGYSQNAFFETRLVQEEFSKVIRKFKGKVENLHTSGLEDYGISPQSDPILVELASLYDNRVGDAPNAEQLTELHQKANDRYERKIPPGFRDLGRKGIPEAYGDFILWHQIMEHAKVSQSDVLLVTDDKKSDWWSESAGEVLGPEPQLRQEFYEATGRLFYAYRSNQFVRLSYERESVPVNEGVVNEISRQVDAQEIELSEYLSKVVAEDIRNERMVLSDEMDLWRERYHQNRVSLDTTVNSLHEMERRAVSLQSEIEMLRSQSGVLTSILAEVDRNQSSSAGEHREQENDMIVELAGSLAGRIADVDRRIDRTQMEIQSLIKTRELLKDSTRQSEMESRVIEEKLALIDRRLAEMRRSSK